MNTMRLRVAIALLLLHAAVVLAEIKNFTFRGTITMMDDREFLLDRSVRTGVAFEGFYIFESGATDSNPDTTVGDYRFNESRFGVVVKVGKYVFRTNPRHVDFLIELVDRPESDHYLFHSYNNVSSEPLYVDHISWQLDDPTARALSDASLPSAPPDLTKFESLVGMTVSGGGGFGGMPYFIRGTVNSIEEAPAVIPERPATTVGAAVEVSWPSALGYFYQIQRSEDLKTWSDVGEPVLGDGTVLSRFFPRQGTQVFYRVEIANFSN